MLKFKEVKTINMSDWDDLVVETYGKPYKFQQQDGCKDRGNWQITIPNTKYCDDFQNISLPYEINGNEMGVNFVTWLNTPEDEYEDIFWERNFYPSVQMVANDLFEKGLIPVGDYVINIDW